MIRTPAFRRNLKASAVDQDAAILASTEEEFTIRGPWCGAVAELINGQSSITDITDRLISQTGIISIIHALILLEQKGLIMEAESELPVSDSAFWQSLDVPPREAEIRIRSASFEVRSFCAWGEELINQAMTRSGLNRDPKSRFLVVIADDYLDPRLEEVNREFRERKVVWILLKLGGIGCIGPLFHSETGCWECLAIRLRENLLVSAAQPVGCTPTTLESLVNLAANEITKWVVLGHSPLEHAVVTVDPFRFRLDRHAVVRRPQCTVCGSGFKLESSRVVLPPLGADGSPTGDEGIMRHLSPVTGIVPFLSRRSAAADYLPVVLGPQRLPAAARGVVRGKGSALVAVGTGTSENEARLSCVGEALERYCVAFDGTEAMVRSRANGLDGPFVSLPTLLQISENQYLCREQFNRTFGGLRIPEPFDDTAEIDWMLVRSLPRYDRCYVPAAYCLLGYPFPTKPEFCWADSNGCAAGRTLEHAILSGFFELVERDAVALWWYNRIQHRAFLLEQERDFLAHEIGRYLEGMGRTLHVLDLTTDLDVPVAAAVSARKDGSAVVFGFGAHLQPVAAIRRALLELQQVLGAADAVMKGDARASGTILERWLRTANLHDQSWLGPAPGNGGLLAHPNPCDNFAACVRVLERHKLAMLVANLTRPDLDVPVVRVIVPGLRSAQPRFAPGRLYEVPCALRWLREPLPESDLNPFPFFL